MEKLRQYSSKILLFGEYAIIHGSSALAIPYAGYDGGFNSADQQYDLSTFYEYLASLSFEHHVLNHNLLEKDIASGIRFVSSIPFGYGLGSSGALTAAVFDRYLKSKELYSVTELKDVFSKIESFFHGESSGIDPLVSYLNCPLLIDQEKEIEMVEIMQNDFQFYLVDTGLKRSTQELVKVYLSKYSNPSFQEKVEKLKSLNTQIIHAYLNNDQEVYSLFEKIADLQLNHFAEMIPSTILDRVKKYKLKLCGAGGGGFFLGLARPDEIRNIQKEMEIKLI